MDVTPRAPRKSYRAPRRSAPLSRMVQGDGYIEGRVVYPCKFLSYKKVASFKRVGEG